MIPVFVPTYELQEFEMSALTLKDIEITRDLTAFLTNSVENKIAIIDVTHAHDDFEKCLDVIDQIKDVRSVIIRSIEVSPGLVKLMSQYDQKNFTYLICGTVEYPMQHATVKTDLYWLYDTARPYLLSKQNFEQTRTDSRQYAFEVMYGLPKRHREFVYAALNNSTDQKRFLQSEFLTTHSVYAQAIETNSIWWEDDIHWEDSDNPHAGVTYKGFTQLRPSQIIPRKIYDMSAYSLICETWFDNGFSFFTEKVGKPLIAKRPFIAISGQHYLRNLRRCGFQTFDGIIDETYDTIEDHVDRWTAAIVAARRLAAKPQSQVLFQTKEIVEHNYTRMKDLFFRTGYKMVELELERLVHLADKSD